MTAAPQDAWDFSDQVIVVTGGTRGIGLGIIRYLARAGAKLAVTGRKPARLEAAQEELDALGVDALFLASDVGDAEACRDVIARTAERFGRIDGLVANAQSLRPVTPLAEVTAKDVAVVFNTGPMGTLWLMQAVLPHMQAQGRGRIVTLGSAMGNTGAPGYGPYSAAKEAIRSLTRTAAREWGKFGITVNCVCPASVAHRMPPEDEGARATAFAAMYANQALGRDGDPEEDIAPTVGFLLSDASQYVTGQTLMVDGGGILRA
ncbi:SDR family oxidoreductase [Myxococcota bacterium]|nr:SDR family oxidoreductase [Myxococcota bacterium]